MRALKRREKREYTHFFLELSLSDTKKMLFILFT